jgi:molecular chaperone HtpG
MAGLKKLHAVDARSPRIADYAQQLYGQALLTEGSPLPDAGAFSKLVTDLMVSAVEG